MLGLEPTVVGDSTMFWGWLSFPLRLILALSVGIGWCCAKSFDFVVHLFTGIHEDIPTLNRLKREELTEKRVIVILAVIGLIYASSLIQGIFLPSQTIARIKPLRPPAPTLPFDKKWQDPSTTCSACGGEDVDLTDPRIVPMIVSPPWPTEGRNVPAPMPWYLLRRSR
jgi:hypothetical protein